MFSSTTEYALRAVSHLAMHPGSPCTAQEIADGTRTPAGYVSKVLQDLARADLVVAQRGPHGGFRLARGAELISALDVVKAVDPFKRIEKCPLGLPEHAHGLCRLHQRLDDAVRLVERTLSESVIAEMIGAAPSGSRCLRAKGPKCAECQDGAGAP